MKLDPAARTVKLSNKQEVGFDKALLATGANVRRLNVPGAELEGIHYLRTLGNADAIREDAAGKRVVLIGGSYIASEVAATLTELGSQCTMVMLESLLLSRHFGGQAAGFFHELLTEHGITVHGEEELDPLRGRRRARHHRGAPSPGCELEADAVVHRRRRQPDVMLARGAGLELGESGGVRVDARLRTSAPGIFAAGDIAEYESVLHGGAGSASSTGTSPSTRAGRRRRTCSAPGRRLRRRALLLLRPGRLGRARVRRAGRRGTARWSAARPTRARSPSGTSTAAGSPAR